jgi:multimeric flavodoxin WrbA
VPAFKPEVSFRAITGSQMALATQTNLNNWFRKIKMFKSGDQGGINNMNILLISSSPHGEKSRTFALGGEVVKGIGTDAKVSVIHLSGKKIEFCKSCDSCHVEILQCPIKDDADDIISKMLVADAIIFASPNYINQITASMKALFDRTSHFIHCKRLLGKYTAAIVTSGSGRNTEVFDYLKHYSNTCGAQYVGGVSAGSQVSDSIKAEAFKLGQSLTAAVKSTIKFPDQLENINRAIGYFTKLMILRKNEWPGEYKYCKDKGWI